MKQIFTILISLFIITSCGKDNSWSPEDDVEDFIKANHYSVIFENNTDGDLYLKCSGLASTNIPTLKKGAISACFRGPKADIAVEYSGEGTHYTTIKKQFTLSKDKVSRVSLTYP